MKKISTLKNECPSGVGQVVKTQSKSSRYFIAVCAMLGSPTGGMVAALAVILMQVVLNMPDVFAGLDWAGLVALGGITRTPEQLSFLPPLPFNPQWPTKNTLADRALKMLMDGRMIDHPDFENDTQSWRLGAVIFTLRTLGWPIETIEIPSPTEQCPDRVIALYHLPAKYVAEALALNGRAYA